PRAAARASAGAGGAASRPGLTRATAWGTLGDRVRVRSGPHGDPLVGLHCLLRHPALAVRQDDLDVHALGLAQAEVGDGLLPRAVAVAGGDLAAAQQLLRLAQLPGGVHHHPAADAHLVDSLVAGDADV